MQRDYGLDVSKIIAMFMVAWGHFVDVGSSLVSGIPGVINGNTALPLLPSDTHALWKVGVFLHVSLPVVGVVVFFIISGIFIPIMQEKYGPKSKSDFFLFGHCFKRVFPTVLISILLIALVERLLQGIHFSLGQILATATGTSSLFHVEPVTGVIWFLIVLEAMWLVSAFFKKYTVQNIFSLYGICLFLVVLPHIPTEHRGPLSTLMVFAHNAQMLDIVLLGVLWSVMRSRRSNLFDKIIYMSLATGLCLITTKMYEVLYNFHDSYDKEATYLAALCVILLGRFLYRWLNKILSDAFKARLISGIKFISNLFLPFYLCHLCVGLNVLFLLKKVAVPAGVKVFLAFVFSLLAAMLVNKIVFYIKLLQNKILGVVKC